MLVAQDIIELAHDAPSSSELYHRLIATLREEFEGDVAMLQVAAAYPITAGGPVASVGFDVERLRAQSHRWLTYVDELEPLRHQATRTREVVSDQDVFSGSVIASKAYYRELTLPEGGLESIVAYLDWRGCSTAAVMLGSRRRRFSRAARSALSELRKTVSLVVAAAPSDRHFHPPGVVLTPREREVVGFLEAGLSNADIAQCLGSSTNTVRNQVAAILRKLELGSRVELAALRLGSYSATHR